MYISVCVCALCTERSAEYRIFWGAWDFPNEFPGGVNFTVGQSDEGRDWVSVFQSMLHYSFVDIPSQLHRTTYTGPSTAQPTPGTTP